VPQELRDLAEDEDDASSRSALLARAEMLGADVAACVPLVEPFLPLVVDVTG
jgi:hypothetical protein